MASGITWAMTGAPPVLSWMCSPTVMAGTLVKMSCSPASAGITPSGITLAMTANGSQGGPMGLLLKSPRESPLPLELLEALEQCCPVLMEYVDGVDHKTERLIQPLRMK